MVEELPQYQWDSQSILDKTIVTDAEYRQWLNEVASSRNQKTDSTLGHCSYVLTVPADQFIERELDVLEKDRMEKLDQEERQLEKKKLVWKHFPFAFPYKPSFK